MVQIWTINIKNLFIGSTGLPGPLDSQVPAEHQEAKDFQALQVLVEILDFRVIHSNFKFVT